MHLNIVKPNNSVRVGTLWGFPGGAVVKNPPANAGDTGSSPGPGKIPHAAEQFSPFATTSKPAL